MTWCKSQPTRFVGVDAGQGLAGESGEHGQSGLDRRAAKALLRPARSLKVADAPSPGDAGLVVDRVSNGQEAIEKVHTTSYELIPMDMRMPVIDGLKATRVILDFPGQATVPILAMTANAFAEARDCCLAAGMSDHIGRSVKPDALYSTLMQWLPKIGSASKS